MTRLPTRLGYPIQWVKAAIPSNTLACLNGLAEDARTIRAVLLASAQTQTEDWPGLTRPSTRGGASVAGFSWDARHTAGQGD
jgi:hypothetical protein